VYGTTWHGAFDSDGFRRVFLTEVADLAGRRFVPAPDTSLAAVKERQYDLLADAVSEHLDTALIEKLITEGAPDGLPFIPPGATE
jgi:adenosylcobyric acid synthase